MKFGQNEIPPKTKDIKKEKSAQFISNKEESIWRMFREDKYEKVHLRDVLYALEYF